MADVFCPICGKSNPTELEDCQFCGARLNLPSPSKPSASQPIKAGDNPVIKNTSEFEKVKLTPGDYVHPGEAPTEKNTGALESTLPSWLRTLRKGDDSAGAESSPDEITDQSLPLGPPPDTSSESSDDQPDWLTGLGKAVSDDEKEIPDWLESLREEKPGTSPQESVSLQERALNTTGSLSAGVGDAEWVARLGSEPKPETPETKPQEEQQGGGESLNWLDSLESESGVPKAEGQPVAPQDEALNDWLSGLPDSSEENQPVPPSETENLPDSSEENQPVPPSETENLPDRLNQLQEKTLEPELTPLEDDGKAADSEIPNWLSNLGSAPVTAEAPSKGGLPEWLSEMETKAGPESAAPEPNSSSDLPTPGTTSEEIPDWLTQLPANDNPTENQVLEKEQFDVAPPPSANREGTGPIPKWLAGIERSKIPSDGTPALITNDEGPGSEENSGAAFSLETPDWLSKLNPEQAFEKASMGITEPSTPENIKTSELPSWVRAMRPVESVLAETKITPQEDAQVTEQTGPLAGLQGVLPSGPGLGMLRKPPAYNSILQVTDGQQRYTAALERLISSETQPQAAKRSRLTSNRLWRWLIAFLLFLAVGLPLIMGIPITPASTLRPPEMVSAFTIISTLPSNAPVLVVFDYDPALSGELEAAAAPLMDHLLLQGPRLALISTSPTGPALAERFLHDSSASPLVAGYNYQSGKQYVNLGYLAGGPAGVQYFANFPSEAAQVTLDGQPAWTLPPLQGVRVLSDFAAVIVLTDNADSGRVWIEQAGSTIGNSPMLMVISAQAEPMILPYYDSGQIKGLVTGLAGGEAYAQTFIRPDSRTGLTERYWDSFSVGTLVTEILIIVGAIWSAIAGWRAPHDKSGEKV
jgi:hypothetical protein